MPIARPTPFIITIGAFGQQVDEAHTSDGAIQAAMKLAAIYAGDLVIYDVRGVNDSKARDKPHGVAKWVVRAKRLLEARTCRDCGGLGWVGGVRNVSGSSCNRCAGDGYMVDVGVAA